jgi:hypothetical protein
MSSKTCGQCQLFVRIKSFKGKHTGICDKYDYNLLADCTHAKYCNHLNQKSLIEEKIKFMKWR